MAKHTTDVPVASPLYILTAVEKGALPAVHLCVVAVNDPIASLPDEVEGAAILTGAAYSMWSKYARTFNSHAMPSVRCVSYIQRAPCRPVFVPLNRQRKKQTQTTHLHETTLFNEPLSRGVPLLVHVLDYNNVAHAHKCTQSLSFMQARSIDVEVGRFVIE